ncbi:ferrous iron transport protein B [Clostridium amazonitimonense]|uniref:ferrous iron transport protein B n=1 Tax=Clostridium amazonitimonense TaxID=1499689 RepID=UPI0005099B2E|nr:ferrous iron transport protein B [Clostridium amazonitimonense]
MGLTYKSTGMDTLTEEYKIDKKKDQFVIALAGNPNTGKSTVFNSLTGLRQHTGNWPGKTVTNARGEFRYNDREYILVDLPGTYSLFSSSVEEEIARDFICFGNSDVVVVIADATCLERNLNLVYQVMELTDNVILCINLIDEAKKKGIVIDAIGIEEELGIPVVLSAARSGVGIDELKEVIDKVVLGKIKPKPNKLNYEDYIEKIIKEMESIVQKENVGINLRWMALRLVDGDAAIFNSIFEKMDANASMELKVRIDEIVKHTNKKKIRDDITYRIYKKTEEIRDKYIKIDKNKKDRDRVIDKYITSRAFGIPIMIFILALVLWITIIGANYPSQLIAKLLFKFEDILTNWFMHMNAPKWLHGILVLGLYRTLAWVVSVMLPPMAIFFPLFTLLEDLGYLPRVAFNLDHLFKKACTHGKQCLTMCMGLGCNAAGVIGCRIIDSPRERLIAIVTNNFIPCNGRFPTLIAVSSVFLLANSKGKLSNLYPALAVTVMVIIGVAITLLVSYVLSKTLLKGVPSSFTLELPPYRKPQVGRILYTSIIDRTIFVLGRAVVVAAPAGVVTWILGNIYIGDLSIISHVASFLNPVANLIGLDGYILMAFILGLPANEIVLPILLMSYMSTGTMIEFESIEALRQILLNQGWTYLTALNVMLFTLLHWPCATTLLTIKKETGSRKWTILSALIPTAIAFIVCFITTSVARILGMI